jgi:hypothetical protein
MVSPREFTEIDYVVITPAYLSETLQPFVEWKVKKGVRTKIYDLETIDTSYPGDDLPAKIRNFLIYARSELATDYVLLVGDYDLLPPRLCADPDPYSGIDDGWIPADSYYACIDAGTSWDADSDGIYGEVSDLDDIIPDLYVGRLAINSETVLAQKIAEIIAYEKTPPTPGDATWFDTATLLAADIYYAGDAARFAEHLHSSYLAGLYATTNKLYESYSGEGIETLTHEGTINAINTGTSFINFIDHGGTTAWYYAGGAELINNNDVANLNNGGMKPVTYALACLTLWFDDPSGYGGGAFNDCIGELFTESIDKGAIAYIGSSRTAVVDLNSMYYGEYSPFANGLLEDFCKALSEGINPIGKIFTEAKLRYATNWGSYFASSTYNGQEQACWLELNLLADPELPIWTSVPKQFMINTSITQQLGDYLEVKIIVNDPTGAIVSGATVCIENLPSIYYCGVTDQNGELVFNIELSAITETELVANLTVTAPNFIPLETTIELIDLEPPVTELEVLPAVPDGENGWYVTTPTIELYTELGATTYYYWDTGTETEYLGDVEVYEGEHVLYYYSVDVAGNVEPLQTYTIKLDTIVPCTTISTVPATPDGENDWFITVPIVTLETTEPNTTILYRWDDETVFTTYTTEFTPSEGVHVLYYRAIDIAGNVEPERTAEFKVDTIAPNATITTSFPPDGMAGWYVNVPQITIATDPDAHVYYYWDVPPPTLYTETLKPPEGVHKLYYYAKDEAGNEGTLAVQEFKLDTKPPETLARFSPPYPDGDNDWYRTIPYCEFVVIGENETTNITIYYRLGAEPYERVYTGTPIMLSEGIHTIYYYAKDEAGNVESEHSVTVKVDITAPSTGIAVTPPFPDGDNGWYVSDDVQIQLIVEANATCYYKWYSGVIHNITEIQYPEVYRTYIQLIEGINTLCYYSVDEAGNTEPINIDQFMLDLQSPQAVLTVSEDTVFVDEYVIIDATSSYDEHEVVKYYYEFGDGNILSWCNTSKVSYTYSEPGIYEVALKVQDASGRESINTAVVAITVKDRPIEEGALGGIELTTPVGGIPLYLVILLIIIPLAVIVGLLLSRRHKVIYRYTAPSYYQAPTYVPAPAGEQYSIYPSQRPEYVSLYETPSAMATAPVTTGLPTDYVYARDLSSTISMPSPLPAQEVIYWGEPIDKVQLYEQYGLPREGTILTRADEFIIEELEEEGKEKDEDEVKEEDDEDVEWLE